MLFDRAFVLFFPSPSPLNGSGRSGASAALGLSLLFVMPIMG
jgi:hypothetical protein